jgi:hypothetical protein
MKRRHFLSASAAGGALMAGGLAAADTKPVVIEIRRFQLRNTPDNMRQKTTDFLKNAALPALTRAGVAPVGVFASMIAPDTPFLLMVTSYPSLAAMETTFEKIGADKEYESASAAFAAGPLGYVRMETSLLRAFRTIPAIEVPQTDGKRPARIFELRTYESNNTHSLRKKVEMFDTGEIAIFRKVGMAPVFFGSTIVGRNMPNLTYMLGYDDLAARDKVWKAFGSDPDWAKLRATPGFSDADIVSNISNILLSPLPFSAIR